MDDGGRRCGSALLLLLDATPVLVVVLRENERGCVGGAMRVVLALPASLSSLSLGEGGGEAVLLRRRKTPLVELPAASRSGWYPIPGDAAPAFVDALDSDSEREMGPDDSTSQSLLAVTTLGVATSSSQPS